MARISPTLEGFRAAFRRPSLTFAEIAWRWTVGALAWALLFFWVIEYLGTLPVSNVDLALLSTRQPFLVGRALAHILRGSLNRATLAALFGAIAVSLLWIILASLGRAATVRALLDYFRRDVSSADSTETSEEPRRSRVLRSPIGLNFLRAALALAATLAFVGAAILMSLVSSSANPQPGLAFILFLLLAAVICIVWPALNWLLSLAAIFTVRDGEDALGAISAAVIFSQERSGPVAAVSTWTGLAHLAVFVGASTLASFPLAFLQIAPVRLVIAGVLLVTLGYVAVADWLYMARLAGYICIAEMPDALVSSAPSPAPPDGGRQFAPAPPAQTTIDRDEPILSDLPLSNLPAFAVET
jgi:hypothetical protein